MKRIFLFLLTNIAVLVVLSVVVRLLGLDRALAANGLDVGALLVFSAVVGFTGAIISLLMSKPMAKWSTGAQVIDTPRERQRGRGWWRRSSGWRTKAGVGMPEVAIYEGEPNAFATGAFRNSALVAVSTGLLSSMSREEIEAVLGHEISHVANGDMVTLTLIQGVVNTFVVFLSRVVAFFVDRIIFRTERGSGPGYFITMIVCADRARRAGEHDRRVVLAPPRISRRRRQRATARHAAADDARTGASGRITARRAAEIDDRLRHHRPFRLHVAVRNAPADRGANTCAAGCRGRRLIIREPQTMAAPLKYKIEVEAPNGLWQRRARQRWRHPDVRQ